MTLSHAKGARVGQRVRSIPGERKGTKIFFVGDVGFQKAAIQEMERIMFPVVPVKPMTDKRSRLQVVAPYIKNGTVLFPRTGCEQLLAQIFNLGVESHDDLCDVLTTLLNGLVEQGLELPKIHWIETRQLSELFLAPANLLSFLQLNV